jgi:D-inositol-3-phosphate glycosyltransferase
LKTMKILMIDPLVGNEYAACLSAGLSRKGVETHLVVTENREISTPGSFIIKRFMPAKNDLYGKTKKVFKYVSYLRTLLKYIRKEKIDIVHYQFFRRKSEIFYFLFLKALRVKLVFTAHNILPHERSKSDYFLKKLVYKNANAIIVHTDYIRTKLLSMFKVNEKKVFIVPHGNFDVYLPSAKISYEEARERLEIKPEDNVLLFFGYIREYKGLDLLLAAFENAAKANKNLKLLIAGNPQSEGLRKTYEDQINSLSMNGLNGRITAHLKFIPAEEVAYYLTASDVVALPYKNIDHSGIVHLAYSFQKPIIATNVGDFPEAIEDGRSGYVLKSNTTKELTEKIIETFSDAEKLKLMGAYAKYLNDTKYSWGEIASRTIDVYNYVKGK